MLIRLGFLAPAVVALAVVACGGGPSYDVEVAFNQTRTPEEVVEVINLLFSYDAEMDLDVEETFPSKVMASISTDVPDFCQVVEEEIAGRDYVATFDCDG